MDDLKTPGDRAGRGPQRDDGVGVAVVALAFAAVKIGAWAAGRDEDQAKLGVSRDYRPGVGRARAVGALALPGLARRIFALFGIGSQLQSSLPARAS